MQSQISRLALAVAILAIFMLAVSSSYQSDNNKKQGDTKPRPKPQKQVQFGPIKFETYYNETRMEDKLRLSKKHVKYAFRWGSGEGQAITIKRTIREDLMRCDNLTFLRAGQESFIDCRPIATHVIDDSYLSTSDLPKSGNYVRTASARIKGPGYKTEIRMYPLLPDVVSKDIDTILESEAMSKLGFDSPINIGYYLEARRSVAGRTTSCDGKFYLSLNSTEKIASNDPSLFLAGQFDDDFENGFFFSLKNLRCRNTGIQDLTFDLSLENDFTLAYRKQFPYLTIHHRSIASPFSTILNYSGIVEQQNDPNSNSPSAYNTTVNINCSSAVISALNFQLDQIFVQEELNVGFEKMLLNTEHILTQVDAVWDGENYLKTALFSHKAGQGLEKKIRDLFSFEILNIGASDEIKLNFKFKRSFVDELVSVFSGLFSETSSTVENNDIETEPKEEL